MPLFSSRTISYQPLPKRYHRKKGEEELDKYPQCKMAQEQAHLTSIGSFDDESSPNHGICHPITHSEDGKAYLV
jgi:hypothetical protein